MSGTDPKASGRQLALTSAHEIFQAHKEGREPVPTTVVDVGGNGHETYTDYGGECPACGGPLSLHVNTGETLCVDCGKRTDPIDHAAAVLARDRCLLDSFWRQRGYLQSIRQAAYARGCSASAVLGIVLARTAALVPHTLRLPAIIGGQANLALIVAAVGPPGSAKSSANSVARELLPAPNRLAPDGLPQFADQLPLGSGEGLVEVLFGTVEVEDGGKKKQERHQVRRNAFVYIDEGEALTRIGRRDGATVLPTLRSIFSAQPIGNTNANRERRRIVAGYAYTYGVVVALQPTKAGELLDDAAAGTPARMLWVDAVDPDIPDEAPVWPGAFDWEPPAAKVDHVVDVDEIIADELREAHLQAARGERVVDDLDRHAGLLRLKVAALLAVLDNRADVDLDDWNLAGQITRASDATRQSVLDAVAYERTQKERAARDRYASREVSADVAVENRRIEDCAYKIRQRVNAEPDRWTVRDLRRTMRHWLDWFEAGLDHAKAEGWVVEVTEPGSGTDKRSLRPGDKPY